VIELRKFVAPEFVFGAGARHLAGRYAKNFGGSRVLVVTDPEVMAAGWAGQVIESLGAGGVPYTLFSQVTPNPKDSEVMAGAELYRQERCGVIVAVGGGSPMDCAKGIGIVSSNRQHILEFEGVDKVEIPGPPLICIPTTAGTSADVSQFAIITDRQRRVKIAIISKAVVPEVALIDPVTTTTMDAALTACTGLDALVHAFEAFVSTAQSPITDLHALEAIRLVTAHLPTAIANPADLKARSPMMLASLHAGLAFSNASLGLVHAMAHSLGGWLDFPHGEANALLLDHVVSFNFDAVPERYRRIGVAMGLELEGTPPAEVKAALIGAVQRLRTAAGISHTLGQKGVRADDIPHLAAAALRDACLATNPRQPRQRDIETIYAKAL